MKLDEKDFKDDYIVKEIGSGATAKCFLTKDDKVYKKFFGNLDYDRLFLNELLKCKNPNITFPTELVYDGNDLVGYIKDYAPGVNIDSLDDNINIKRFADAIEDFERNIFDTFFSFVFIDMNGENLVYDEKENKITIIDTDFFKPAALFDEEQYQKTKNRIDDDKEKGYPQTNSFIESKKWICQSFYSLFKDAEEIDGKIGNYIQEGYTGIPNTSFTLKKVIELLEQTTNKEINTLGDYRNAIEEAKEQVNGKTRI